MSFDAFPGDRPFTDADQIRRVLSRHAAEISAFKVKSLRLFGPDDHEVFLEDGELGIIVEFDYSRLPTFFDQVGLENRLAELLNRPVHVFSAGGYEPERRARTLEQSIRVL